MKTRIIKKKNFYIAQRKVFLFFWSKWFKDKVGKRTYMCTSLEDVENFIQDMKEKK